MKSKTGSCLICPRVRDLKPGVTEHRIIFSTVIHQPKVVSHSGHEPKQNVRKDFVFPALGGLVFIWTDKDTLTKRKRERGG